MTRIEDDCNGCTDMGLPCRNCGRDRTPHYYCDRCGDETTLYRFDDEELCEDCLLKCFDVVEGSE